MDFNGDGRHDVISGSYSPGYLFVFAQKEDGTYAASEKIKDATGKSIKVGYAAHVHAADWDSDEDLDLVIGNISGEVYFVRNDGKPGENAFGNPEPLQAGESRLQVGHGDAGPVLADWNGDGLLDLIVGAGDGSITYYPNKGSKSEPALGEGQLLIGASEGKGDESSCGTRTKVWVTDYNGDGHLDLLVGDFASLQKKQPELTAAQRAEAEKAQKEYKAAMEEYSAASNKTKLPELAKQYRALQEEPAGETPEAAKDREERAEELMEQIQEIQQKELQPFVDRMAEIRKQLPNSGRAYHGFVWLYLRQPSEASAE